MRIITNDPGRQNVRKVNRRGSFLKPYGLQMSNLVVNGGFDSGDSWTLGAGWSIAAGVATGAAGAASALTQGPLPLTQGKRYQVAFTITAITAGGVAPNIGATLGTLRTAAGRYTEVIVAGASSAVVFDKDAAFIGSIDNVVVYELPL